MSVEVSDADGSFQSGDSFIVYPAIDGNVYDSIRHEVMFDAFQDYIALKNYSRVKLVKKSVMDFLKTNGLEENFTNYPKSAVWHKNIKNEINLLVMKK